MPCTVNSSITVTKDFKPRELSSATFPSRSGGRRTPCTSFTPLRNHGSSNRARPGNSPRGSGGATLAAAVLVVSSLSTLILRVAAVCAAASSIAGSNSVATASAIVRIKATDCTWWCPAEMDVASRRPDSPREASPPPPRWDITDADMVDTEPWLRLVAGASLGISPDNHTARTSNENTFIALRARARR